MLEWGIVREEFDIFNMTLDKCFEVELTKTKR